MLQGRPSNKKIQKVPSYLLPLKIRKWGMESTFVPFLKIRKWELRSSEMAHREAKTEYLGAYKFFYPRFVWEPTIRPTCHAGKGD